MQSNYGVISDPDLPPIAHPAPLPTISSSSLLHALAYDTARLPPRSTETTRKPPSPNPPPLYNPYPYAPRWRLDRAAHDFESNFFHTRQDRWHLGLDGMRLIYVDRRNALIIRRGIMQRQFEAQKRYELELFDARAPVKVESGSDSITVVVFMTAEGGQRGLPAKMLLSTRRALERGMQDPKGKCFVESSYGDKIWVRLKWPAYPDHEVKKVILVTIRAGHNRPRRPITRLELVVALTAILTQYHSEVSTLEPSPAFAHLALGQGEGRLSLYALRMIGIRVAPDGVFDLMVELDNGGEGNPAAANYERTHQESVSFADMESLIRFSRSPQVRPDRVLADAGASSSQVSSPSVSGRALEHAEASSSSQAAGSSSIAKSTSATESSPASTSPSDPPPSSSLPIEQSAKTPEKTVGPGTQDP
ncbi:hypothetical protein C8Q73DRAFT_704850 [Cubamyces lactineus]|nr:hypothetical protein C8Q73DRAFT_704850 [Cubamyces lactineus]